MKLLIYLILVSSVTATRQFYDLSNVLAFLEKNFGKELSQNHEEVEEAPLELATRQLNGVQTIQVNRKACPPGTVLNIAGSCIEPVVERKVFLFSLPEEDKRKKKVIANPRTGYRVILINNLDHISNKDETIVSKSNPLESPNPLEDRQKNPSGDATTKPIDLSNQNGFGGKTFNYQNQLEPINSENEKKNEKLKVDIVTNVAETANPQEPSEEGKEAKSLVELSENENDKLLPPKVLGTTTSNTFAQSGLPTTEIPNQMAAASISNFHIQTENRSQSAEIPQRNQNLFFPQSYVPNIPQNTLITKKKVAHRNIELYDPFNPSLSAHIGPRAPRFFLNNPGYNQRLRPSGSPVLFNPSNVKLVPNDFFRLAQYPVIDNIVPNPLRLSAISPFIKNPAYKQAGQSVFYNLPFLNNESPSQRPGLMFLPFWKTSSKLDRFPFLAWSKNAFQNQRLPFSPTTPFLTRTDRNQDINSQVNSILNSNRYLPLSVSNVDKINDKQNDLKTTAVSRLNSAVESTLKSARGDLKQRPNLPIQVTQFRPKTDRTHPVGKDQSRAFQTGSGPKFSLPLSQFTLKQERKYPLQNEQTKALQTANLDLPKLPAAKGLNNLNVNQPFHPVELQTSKGGYRNQVIKLEESGDQFLKLKPDVTRANQSEDRRDEISSQTDVIHSSNKIKSNPVQISRHKSLAFGTKKQQQSISTQSKTEDDRSHLVEILPHQKLFSADKNIITSSPVSRTTHFGINANPRPLPKIQNNSSLGLETDIKSRKESKETVVESKKVSSEAVPTTERKSRLSATSDPANRRPLVTSESGLKGVEQGPDSFPLDPNLKDSSSFRSGNNKESFIKINFGSIKDFPSVYVDLSKKSEQS